VLRTYLRSDEPAFEGRFYAAASALQPRPTRPDGPPIWIGSWGSDAGLRRVARLGDGWLASAYNTMPDQFAAGLAKLREQLKSFRKDPAQFPNALATMFMYITENRSEAERVLSERLGIFLHRPFEQLRERLLVGAPETCAEKLAAYKKVGVQRVFIWPVKNDIEQLAIFQKQVVPLVPA
jgi:alkanesulfonate monooxygenase SsuD/methylene tetrahydromethanopterin reductase-like flavin-dependent oxidoreductase (luciferase family)